MSNEPVRAPADGEPARGESANPRPADFAFNGLERVIHERARLSILSSLAAHPAGLVFNDIKKLCALTDGNLSRQLTLLQEEGFVEIWKGMRNNRPSTLVRLSESGRTRFIEYLAELERVIRSASAVDSSSAHGDTPSPKPKPA